MNLFRDNKNLYGSKCLMTLQMDESSLGAAIDMAKLK